MENFQIRFYGRLKYITKRIKIVFNIGFSSKKLFSPYFTPFFLFPLTFFPTFYPNFDFPQKGEIINIGYVKKIYADIP